MFREPKLLKVSRARVEEPIDGLFRVTDDPNDGSLVSEPTDDCSLDRQSVLEFVDEQIWEPCAKKAAEHWEFVQEPISEVKNILMVNVAVGPI
jgi:hypothetical protein